MHRTIGGGKDFWLACLRHEGPAFRAAVAATRPDADVPSCPEWTVESLVAHLGRLYAWIRGHAERGVVTPPAPFAEFAVEVPAWPHATEWWGERFDLLLGTFEHLDPGLPAWNWAPQAKTASFWLRRAAHETAVHRWDAQAAAGTPTPTEAKQAADGVSEVLDTFLPAGRRPVPAPRDGVVHLAATDIAAEWYVRLRGDGVALLDTDTLLDSDDHHPRAHASGTASDLHLALWGRVPFTVLQVSGDADLLPALRAR
ncbi:MAG TPA: maleylpyruvate isomerase family mycothiol-dependent enzyme [Pilimelia sp.]|nr:maleylpyruvate isomerase family mycothiol-dependent enzyme [Pilimelia sp.]